MKEGEGEGKEGNASALPLFYLSAETLATQAIPWIKLLTEFTAIARISRWLELFFVSLQSSSNRGLL